MQYNFEVRTELPDEDVQAIADAGSKGMEASSQLIVQAKIRVNTELPDKSIEDIRKAVSKTLSKQLGIKADFAHTGTEQ
jgi:F0F1-type ATP synthase delta subunit